MPDRRKMPDHRRTPGNPQKNTRRQDWLRLSKPKKYKLDKSRPRTEVHPMAMMDSQTMKATDATEMETHTMK